MVGAIPSWSRIEFVSPVLLNATAETAHRNERVALKFDQPVRVGEGRVHAEIVDQKNPALVYHEQDESVEAVFTVVDDPFVVWVNLTRFSFYPYATYRLHWEDGALQTWLIVFPHVFDDPDEAAHQFVKVCRSPHYRSVDIALVLD